MGLSTRKLQRKNNNRCKAEETEFIQSNTFSSNIIAINNATCALHVRYEIKYIDKLNLLLRILVCDSANIHSKAVFLLPKF